MNWRPEKRAAFSNVWYVFPKIQFTLPRGDCRLKAYQWTVDLTNPAFFDRTRYTLCSLWHMNLNFFSGIYQLTFDYRIFGIFFLIIGSLSWLSLKTYCLSFWKSTDEEGWTTGISAGEDVAREKMCDTLKTAGMSAKMTGCQESVWIPLFGVMYSLFVKMNI